VTRVSADCCECHEASSRWGPHASAQQQPWGQPAMAFCPFLVNRVAAMCAAGGDSRSNERGTAGPCGKSGATTYLTHTHTKRYDACTRGRAWSPMKKLKQDTSARTHTHNHSHTQHTTTHNTHQMHGFEHPLESVARHRKVLRGQRLDRVYNMRCVRAKECLDSRCAATISGNNVVVLAHACCGGSGRWWAQSASLLHEVLHLHHEHPRQADTSR